MPVTIVTCEIDGAELLVALAEFEIAIHHRLDERPKKQAEFEKKGYASVWPKVMAPERCEKLQIVGFCSVKSLNEWISLEFIPPANCVCRSVLFPLSSR